MPTYDYECDACGHTFEFFQSITSNVKRTCPECKKKKLRRLFGTGAAVIFKGSGFYETDYRRKTGKPSSSSSSSSDKSSSDSKKESTPKTDTSSKNTA